MTTSESSDRLFRLVTHDRIRSIVIPNFVVDHSGSDTPGSAERRGWIIVSWLSPEKGVLDLARDWTDGQELTVIGSVPQLPQVEDLARDRPWMTLLTSVPQEELRGMPTAHGGAHERGFDPQDRAQPGHWEGDIIVGPIHRSAIGTLVERKTRYVKLLHLPAHDSLRMHAALFDCLGALPESLRTRLTWDQGIEMTRHLDVTHDVGIKIYFCDAASPWQRDTNENTNEVLCQYFQSPPTCPGTAGANSRGPRANETTGPA